MGKIVGPMVKSEEGPGWLVLSCPWLNGPANNHAIRNSRLFHFSIASQTILATPLENKKNDKVLSIGCSLVLAVTPKEHAHA